MNNKEYKKWYLVIAIFVVIITIFGGSLAYWQWTSNTEQKTSIALTVKEDFRCDADGGGNISNEEKYLVPTSCTNTDYAIQRKITINPSLFSNQFNVSMDLWLDINNISTNLSNSDNFKYALTTSSSSCIDDVISMGTFKNKKNGDTVPLIDNQIYASTITDTYYLYIWLDYKETNSNTMNQSFNFSLNGECTNKDRGTPFYAVYSEDDNSLRFYKEEENVIKTNTTYNNLNVTNVYTGYEGDTYQKTNVPWSAVKSQVQKIIIEDEISPISTEYWFSEFTKTSNIDISNLNTSNTTNMRYMFNKTGYDSTISTFTITGLNDLDTSNVTSMTALFQNTGYYATNFDIGDLSEWDVSNVKNMVATFSKSGYNASTFNIGNLSEWNTSNVISMRTLFQGTGVNATSFNIGDLSNWNVSNVLSMQNMFNGIAKSAKSFNIGDLSEWDVSNVINMHAMFNATGFNATSFNIGNLSEWDVSNVTNMQSMFNSAGKNATSFNIGDLSEWDVSNVINMHAVFNEAGYSSTSFNIGNLDNWNVSNVTNMYSMFEETGYNATSFNIGDLSNWNVSSVTSMPAMFQKTGYYATNFNIGNLDNWNVSNVTWTEAMFKQTGYNATSFNIGNLSKWNTSNVTNMKEMFYQTGYNATNFNQNLSSWNVPLVTTYTDFNTGVESKVTPPTWVNENIDTEE